MAITMGIEFIPVHVNVYYMTQICTEYTNSVSYFMYMLCMEKLIYVQVSAVTIFCLACMHMPSEWPSLLLLIDPCMLLGPFVQQIANFSNSVHYCSFQILVGLLIPMPHMKNSFICEML